VSRNQRKRGSCCRGESNKGSREGASVRREIKEKSSSEGGGGGFGGKTGKKDWRGSFGEKSLGEKFKEK